MDHTIDPDAGISGGGPEGTPSESQKENAQVPEAEQADEPADE